ncbi:uncharacterized protein LOC144910422 isoform X2 [Branchiostoma floridae x Branchiostoma belcheri]
MRFVRLGRSGYDKSYTPRTVKVPTRSCNPLTQCAIRLEMCCDVTQWSCGFRDTAQQWIKRPRRNTPVPHTGNLSCATTRLTELHRTLHNIGTWRGRAQRVAKFRERRSYQGKLEMKQLFHSAQCVVVLSAILLLYADVTSCRTVLLDLGTGPQHHGIRQTEGDTRYSVDEIRSLIRRKFYDTSRDESEGFELGKRTGDARLSTGLVGTVLDRLNQYYSTARGPNPINSNELLMSGRR